MFVVDKQINLRNDDESIIQLLMNLVVVAILEKWKMNLLVDQPCAVCRTNKV